MECYRLFRLARVLQGKTLAEVATSAGITHQSVNAFEKGIASLSIETLQKMAVAININPEYLTDPNVNPFLSDEIIKMEIPENLFIPGLDFQIFRFLAEKNSKLKFCFLFSNTILAKKLLRGTVFENPVWAIACQDDVKNVFLFKRRRVMRAPLVGDRELRIELDKFRNEKKSIMIEDKEIGDTFLKKIKSSTVTKDELEKLFPEEDEIILNENEKKLIMKIRSKGMNLLDFINPADV